jgi:hypothetical protein
MLVVPLQAVPSQAIAVTLAGQACKIAVAQRRTGMFVDLYVNDAAIITGVIAQNANRIVRDTYLGFIGDLAFFDTLGAQDPDYTGLGTRYVLMYLEASDL